MRSALASRPARRAGRHAVRWLAVLLLAAPLLAACVKSPTGRRQLVMLPEDRMASLGREQFAQMRAERPTEQDPTVNGYVRCVAMAVAHEARNETGISDWEVVVFREDSANAFALPGGRIGVHTGMLRVAETPDQLAAVLGHEVGHVIARHGNERLSQTLTVQLGLAAAAVALERAVEEDRNRGLILGALGLGAQYGILLPFSRLHESEADRIGQRLMAEAGFDPRASVALWQNMQRATGSGPPEFLSTHPSHTSRIADLRAQLPATRPVYEKARRRGRTPNCGSPPKV